MALEYKLEFIYDDTSSTDASVFIQLRRNTPVYQTQIAKEDYEPLPATDKNDFLTALFNVAGVVEVSSMAYRVWIMKSPVYTWIEVLTPLMDYLKTFYGETELQPLSGSGNLDGTGFTLTSILNRRLP